MKTFFLIFFVLIFQSQSSFGDWKKIGETDKMGVYIDFDRIRKNQGYLYYWEMRDVFVSNKWGMRSGIVYKQGDCNLFRYKILTDTMYDNFKGTGKIISSSNTPDKEWTYPKPGTVNEMILKSVCQN